MKKLFSTLGSLVLFILITIATLLIYPVNLKIALIGIVAGLVIILGIHHGFHLAVKPSIMKRSNTFRVPIWCEAVFISLLFVPGLLFYVSFYKLDFQVAPAQSIFAIRYISILLVASSILSLLHWQVLRDKLYLIWRRQHYNHYLNPEILGQDTDLESLETEEYA